MERETLTLIFSSIAFLVVLSTIVFGIKILKRKAEDKDVLDIEKALVSQVTLLESLSSDLAKSMGEMNKRANSVSSGVN